LIVSPLINALKDPDWKVRDRAVKLLRLLRKDILGQGLATSLMVENDFVRSIAINTVGYYSHSPKVRATLSRIAGSDSRKAIRNAARKSLIKIQQKLRLLNDYQKQGA
jgi:hypothetical protein